VLAVYNHCQYLAVHVGQSLFIHLYTWSGIFIGLSDINLLGFGSDLVFAIFFIDCLIFHSSRIFLILALSSIVLFALPFISTNCWSVRELK
jgi:hypothetical protein